MVTDHYNLIIDHWTFGVRFSSRTLKDEKLVPSNVSSRYFLNVSTA